MSYLNKISILVYCIKHVLLTGNWEQNIVSSQSVKEYIDLLWVTLLVAFKGPGTKWCIFL